MARRNEQGYEERRRQILDGALQVFAGKGFEKATNRDVARAAGIASPGLIYHYFKDKADLFRQVVEERVPLLQLLSHSEDLMDLPPREMLSRIGRAYLRSMEQPQAVALMRLVIGEAARRPSVARMFTEMGPDRIFRFLAIYLERQMDAGALRRADPAIAGRAFFSPLVVYILTREVFGQPDAQRLDPEAVLTTTLDVFLTGMEPR